ncbi:MAG: acetylxylan esterase [Candidatus Hydrogenedentes bacterium]|nr:acetylxylan esterase [Candidatus Hydrogenedentota bacterium]
MTAVLILVASFAAGDQALVWREPPESNLTVDVPLNATYHVWLWAPAKSGASANVDGKPVKAEPNKDGNAYGWLRAAAIALKKGQIDVKLGEKVAGIVLTTSAEYKPDTAAKLTHVYDEPRAVRDDRTSTIRDTDTTFTMPYYESAEQWEAYAKNLRRRVLLSSGLLPMPEKTPLNAEISGRVDHDDYSVEKVRIEARPGFLVTGNLYRPKGAGPFPAVVCPHGHWEQGRLANEERGSVPGRCITMARMGAVVFSYDMIGYVDSMQYKHNWGGQSEKLWGYHPFAAQLWSSIRAVDFVQSLPDVDPERVGCTGASGGGTQAFALCAVDPRVKVSAPVNMISSTMQGGCLCENAPILRLDASNMQIGALMAPRPILMVSATGDWTKETPRVEFPAIQSVYALYDEPNNVETILIDAPHNYNKASREAVYRFFGSRLLNQPDKYKNFTEPEFQVEPEEALRVFPDKKMPEGLPTADEITARVIEADKAKWAAIMPTDRDSLDGFRSYYGDVLALVTGARIPARNDFTSERTGYEQRDGFVVERWILHRRGEGDSVPAVLYRGANNGPRQDAVVLVYEHGKKDAADMLTGKPGPVAAGLIAQGKAVLAIDCFLTGDLRSERVTGKFPDTFMPTDTGYRIQDIITAAEWLRSRRDMTYNVALAGFGQAGVWALFAAAIDPAIGPVVVDAKGFNPDDDEAWVKLFYIPCIRSVGDMATAAALIAPRPLLIMNATPEFAARINSGYKAGGTTATIVEGDAATEQIIEHFKG